MNTNDTLLLATAEQLAARLCRDSLWHKQQCTWFGPSMEMVDGQWQVIHKTCGPDLYAGTSGIALFLAELNATFNDAEFARTARAAMTHAFAQRHSLRGDSYAGFFSGLVGLAYTCQRMFELTNDEHWNACVQTLSSEMVEHGPEAAGLDVVMGSAGAVSPLLALAESRKEPALLELAIRHGDALLENATDDEYGTHWTMLPGMAPLTGYAHGAAGAILALQELFDVTGDPRFDRAATSAIAWEQQHFDEHQQNWPDLREHEHAANSVCGLAWCHGAPGIGLSRLRGWEISRQPDLYEQAVTAVNTTSRFLAGVPDLNNIDFTYCHGITALTELLLEAARAFEQPQFRMQAESLVHQVCENKTTHFADWACGVPEGAGEAPGLMLGIAGIGYSMLRFSGTSKTPSILVPGRQSGRQPLEQSSGIKSMVV